MTITPDQICPGYVQERRIGLSLRAPNEIPRAEAPIDLLVSYAATSDAGIVLPLELLIVAPSVAFCERRVFRRFAPPMFGFTPRMSGKYSLVLREMHHNQWFGQITISVQDPQ